MGKTVESNTATEEKGSHSWMGYIVWPSVIVIVYFLSFGPVLMMLEEGRIAHDNRLVWNFYWPLTWAFYHTSLRKPMGMYFHLWSERFDKNGEVK